MNRTYICIDLKSFYASVECALRNLDPLNTNLVVADISRTEKTICLAVSPSLKSYGIPGRARLFEVVQKVRSINYQRKKDNNYINFKEKSYLDSELKKYKNLELDYIIATPRMSKYIEYSSNIYNVYLKYLSPDDIYVYSIDEVFCDITDYLNTYNMSAEELVSKMIRDVYNETGITATAGIGTNMYLAKIAMDIVAKHKKANEIGVRIASLDEMNYRKELWSHTPLTDFWRVGRGYAKKLEANNIYTMGDIARTSIDNEELFYKLFGINAELLIDHAWGYEPCTMKDIKEYKPASNSVSSGQVLHCAYNYEKTKLVIKEMADLIALDLVSKHLVTNQLVLMINYDIESLDNYSLDTVIDYYGRVVPKPAHGSINLDHASSSSKVITKDIIDLYEKIVNKNLMIKKINITANNLVSETKKYEKQKVVQFDLFTNYEEIDEINKNEINDEEEEKKVQEVMINLKSRYGKNSILKGMNLEDGATTMDRNNQIGGHRK